MDVPILAPPVTRWECPNCPLQQETRQAGAHVRMHPCPGLGGLTAPMVVAGSGARVGVREREDYVGHEQVQLHNGRPVMSIVTERPDGSTDAVVFAPTATAHSRS